MFISICKPDGDVGVNICYANKFRRSPLDIDANKDDNLMGIHDDKGCVKLLAFFRSQNPPRGRNFWLKLFEFPSLLIYIFSVLLIIIVIVKIHIKQLGWKLQFHCIAN